MKKLAIISAGVLAVVALAVSVFAYGPNWGRGHGGRECYGGGAWDRIKATPGMNLTAEQTAKIDAIREAGLKDIKPILDKLFSKRGDLKLLWLEKKPDQKKIAETKKELRALRDQMEDKIDNYRLEALNLLTPEQVDKLKSFKSRRSFGPGMKGESGCQGAPGHPGGGPGMGMRDN
ncbi:MAG: Spy/CpxP family protein refolding chaperone [Desulforhabdus sp.]|jgi:Spy/CpxP family protein refolding chaperone|nr:Spy/CpxP family protein refolding chaperone [Desulforhabdus sp.]